MTEAIVSLGSNLGDRKGNIEKALASMKLIPETVLLKVSNFYETKPFKVPDKQGDYINCCAKLETGLDSSIFLGCLLGIEAAMGRERHFKFCARVIDIDLLIFGNEVKNSKNLILPHPRIRERAFVLTPMHDINPNMNFGKFDFNADYLKVCL